MRFPHNEPLGAHHQGEPRGPASGRDTGRAAVAKRRGALAQDDGAAVPDGPDGPERRCILTGRHAARDDLIRLALSPDGAVWPDVLARAPGRGAWIGVTRAELDVAMAKGKLKGGLARAFKGAPVSIPADLPDRIEQALRKALTDRLGLELRGGAIILGTEKIAAAARSGVVRFLAHASDAGADGAGKLAQSWRVGEMAEGSGRKGVILPLDRAALSVALGRDNVVHLAMTNAAAATRVAGLVARLNHFLGCDTHRGKTDDDAGTTDSVSDNHAFDVIDTKGE